MAAAEAEGLKILILRRMVLTEALAAAEAAMTKAATPAEAQEHPGKEILAAAARAIPQATTVEAAVVSLPPELKELTV